MGDCRSTARTKGARPKMNIKRKGLEKSKPFLFFLEKVGIVFRYLRVWFSGRILPCHGRVGGSIPPTRTKTKNTERIRCFSFSEARVEEANCFASVGNRKPQLCPELVEGRRGGVASSELARRLVTDSLKFVHPPGFEPRISGPKPLVISISPRVQTF